MPPQRHHCARFPPPTEQRSLPASALSGTSGGMVGQLAHGARCQKRSPSPAAQLVRGLLQLSQAAPGTRTTLGPVTRSNRRGGCSLALMNRIRERSPLPAPSPAPGKGPGEPRGVRSLFTHSKENSNSLCRVPSKGPRLDFRICTTKPAGVRHRPGLRLEPAAGRRQQKPWRLRGPHVLVTAIPPGTLLTSARGEHDGPADIILVVHVAFD